MGRIARTRSRRLSCLPERQRFSRLSRPTCGTCRHHSAVSRRHAAPMRAEGCASRIWVESERPFLQVCRSRGGSWASGRNRHTSTMRKRVSFQTHSLAHRACMGANFHLPLALLLRSREQPVHPITPRIEMHTPCGVAEHRKIATGMHRTQNATRNLTEPAPFHHDEE